MSSPVQSKTPPPSPESVSEKAREEQYQRTVLNILFELAQASGSAFLALNDRVKELSEENQHLQAQINMLFRLHVESRKKLRKN